MKQVKQKKSKQKYARICPKCGSLDIYQETPGAPLNIIFGMPTKYKCKNCGFSSYIFPEVLFSEKKVGCRKSKRFSSIDLNEKKNLDKKEKTSKI